MIENKVEIINKMLFEGTKECSISLDQPWAFSVHASVIENWKNILDKLSIKFQILEHKLHIGPKCYDMHLIMVTPVTDQNLNFLRRSIEKSQISFPWKDNPTLFINVDSYNIMKDFLTQYNLQSYVLNAADEEIGITTNDEKIKVVEFTPSVNVALDLVGEYEKYLSTVVSQPLQYYYMTFALPWLQPHYLKPISLDDSFGSLFHIIFSHLKTLNYPNQLNIMDLLSLRLALCDYRSSTPSSNLKYEIDFMIGRELPKLVENDHLDLNHYFIDKNCGQIEFLINYLVYEFQDFFNTVNTGMRYELIPAFKSYDIFDTIRLVDQPDPLNIIKDKYNIMFFIDGTGYNRMSLSLFLNLVECPNVNRICLDTEYKWIQDACQRNGIVSKSDGLIDVCLIGTNRYKFSEDFIASLRTVSFLKKRFWLEICCTLTDYNILNNIEIDEIQLPGTHVDNHILNYLNNCNLKANIVFPKCTFENKLENWTLLNNIKKSVFVNIKETESTWLVLFQFIWAEVLKSNAREFQFDARYLTVVIEHINLTNLKFTVNEQYWKLEPRQIVTNDIVDLYYEKFRLKLDDKSKYSFYH